MSFLEDQNGVSKGLLCAARLDIALKFYAMYLGMRQMPLIIDKRDRVKGKNRGRQRKRVRYTVFTVFFMNYMLK